MDLDPGEYDACTYCGKSIFRGAAECPYCHNYTDGKGPLGLDGPDAPRKLPRMYLIVGWILLAVMLLPFLWALAAWWMG